jgi:hypothetical protein
MALEEEQIVDELATGAIELNVSALPDEKVEMECKHRESPV